MLRSCKEEDFYKIKSVSFGRLSPSGVSGFFWGCFVLSTITTIFAFMDSLSAESTFMTLMVLFSLIFWIFQFIFNLFFSIKKLAYKFQRFLSLYLSLIGFKVSIDTYQVFFGICLSDGTPPYIENTGIILFFGGIILLIFSTLRAVKRVKQDELRKEGKGLYNFQNSKSYVSLPIIFGVTMFGGAIGKYMSEVSTDFTVFLFLLFAVIMQYGIALVLPEFFLLMYCKFRFESFRVERPK
ncbi:hypothetical protein [Neobacillus sp. LXY-4]|uniref:hypothetical protein n=1 Tax=Neobacillus sp. LXY-4 TaxID=3379826 RepID=UPI003EDF11CE